LGISTCTHIVYHTKTHTHTRSLSFSSLFSVVQRSVLPVLVTQETQTHTGPNSLTLSLCVSTTQPLCCLLATRDTHTNTATLVHTYTTSLRSCTPCDKSSLTASVLPACNARNTLTRTHTHTLTHTQPHWFALTLHPSGHIHRVTRAASQPLCCLLATRHTNAHTHTHTHSPTLSLRSHAPCDNSTLTASVLPACDARNRAVLPSLLRTFTSALASRRECVTAAVRGSAMLAVSAVSPCCIGERERESE
jgi:hypothetical protein